MPQQWNLSEKETITGYSQFWLPSKVDASFMAFSLNIAYLASKLVSHKKIYHQNLQIKFVTYLFFCCEEIIIL